MCVCVIVSVSVREDCHCSRGEAFLIVYQSLLACLTCLTCLYIPFYLLPWTCSAAKGFQVAVIDPRTDHYFFPAHPPNTSLCFHGPTGQNSQPVWMKKAIQIYTIYLKLALKLEMFFMAAILNTYKHFFLYTFRNKKTKLQAVVINVGATFHSNYVAASAVVL